MEEDWDDEINSNNSCSSVKIETQIWRPSNHDTQKVNNDFPRSRGRGFWNKSDDQNWRQPQTQDSFGRQRNQNSFGRADQSNESFNNSDRGFARGARSTRGGFGGNNRDDSNRAYGTGRSQPRDTDSSIVVPSSCVGMIIGKFIVGFRYQNEH